MALGVRGYIAGGGKAWLCHANVLHYNSLYETDICQKAFLLHRVCPIRGSLSHPFAIPLPWLWWAIVMAITLARFLICFRLKKGHKLEEEKRGLCHANFYITILYMNSILFNSFSCFVGCAQFEAHCRIRLQYHCHGFGGPWSWPSPWPGFLMEFGFRKGPLL